MPEEPAAQPAPELSDIGQLTLQRFTDKWGKAGRSKFDEAIDDGHISRHKMYRARSEPKIRQHQGKFRPTSSA
jgi:hypothetical protein